MIYSWNASVKLKKLMYHYSLVHEKYEMTKFYNEAVATHYSSYRPPLHQIILKRVLSNNYSFSTGADIGCGTGYSTIALAAYCDHVYGIDPSQSMLNRATGHKKITYLEGSGGNLPLPDRSVDIVTFAGSFFYVKVKPAVNELKRICRKDALVILYDFEIQIEAALQKMGIDLQENESNYDYSVSLSEVAGFKELAAGSEQIDLKLTSSEFAHILLSNLPRCEAFTKKYHPSDPLPALTSELTATDKPFIVKANLYYSKYRAGTVSIPE